MPFLHGMRTNRVLFSVFENLVWEIFFHLFTYFFCWDAIEYFAMKTYRSYIVWRGRKEDEKFVKIRFKRGEAVTMPYFPELFACLSYWFLGKHNTWTWFFPLLYPRRSYFLRGEKDRELYEIFSVFGLLCVSHILRILL